MKHLFISLFFLCAVSVNTSAQDVTYDPCGELRIALVSADRLVVEGKLDEALAKLNKFKDDPEMQNCPEMKEGVVDYKIKDIQKKKDDQIPKLPSYKKCPDNNHPHLIDMGLPSGTKWACCNVGATKPEEKGGNYAWGETEDKKYYSWETYNHCDGTKESCHDLGKSICGSQFDVAYVKWGKSWQLPSVEQIDELINNCKSKKVKVNGMVVGRMFTSKKNGSNIILPLAVHSSNHAYYVDYWSGTQYSKGAAYTLYYGGSRVYRRAIICCEGLKVRPVAK